MIQIDTPPGELLKFEGGNLYSEYLDQGKVRYKLVKDSPPREELKQLKRAQHQAHGPGAPPWGRWPRGAVGSNTKPQLAGDQASGKPMPDVPSSASTVRYGETY